MKRPITKRIISLTIITVMLITSMTVNLHASVGEEESIKTSDEAPDDAPPSEHSTEISQNEELSDVDNLESNNSEPNMLSDEQTDAKEQLQEDVSVLTDCEAGEDYVENELVVLCDSIEDAETIAEEYSETLGSEIALDDFEYGVATLVINDEEIKYLLEHRTLPSLEAKVEEKKIEEVKKPTTRKPRTKKVAPTEETKTLEEAKPSEEKGDKGEE